MSGVSYQQFCPVAMAAEILCTRWTVVVLRELEGLSYKEIAAAIDVPMGTVMSRISRGRRLLRSELASYARAHGFGQSGQRRFSRVSEASVRES